MYISGMYIPPRLLLSFKISPSFKSTFRNSLNCATMWSVEWMHQQCQSTAVCMRAAIECEHDAALACAARQILQHLQPQHVVDFWVLGAHAQDKHCCQCPCWHLCRQQFFTQLRLLQLLLRLLRLTFCTPPALFLHARARNAPQTSHQGLPGASAEAAARRRPGCGRCLALQQTGRPQLHGSVEGTGRGMGDNRESRYVA